MNVLFLDFDGVILDSAGETAVTAWRGGRRLWPDQWSGDHPPEWLIDSFSRLRPLLHTGYEAFGLLRLAWLAGEEAGRNLAPTAEHRRRAAALLTATGRQRRDLVELFGSTRDHWLQNDFQGWLQANRFYPGVVDSLRRRLGHPDPKLFILTTKQERFVRALLEHAGLNLNPACIFGLDDGVPKRQRLLALNRNRELKSWSRHFIEDRLATLFEIAEEESLSGLHLHLARWGYTGAEDKQRLAGQKRINSLSLEEFRRLIENHAGEPAGGNN